MKNKITYILIFVLTLGICYFVFINVITESYPVVPNEVRERLLIELKLNNIWHVKEGDKNIRFLTRDRTKVLAIASSTANLVLPISRSFSPAPEIFNSFIKCLEQKGIKYEIKDVNSKKWVVYETAVHNIQEECLFNGI
jgi:hypothetical protein